MPKGRPDDLTGWIVGSWTVLSRSGTTSYGKVMWLCRCTCGTEKPVMGANLIKGRSTQCRKCAYTNRKRSGPQPKDLTGRTFGSWTALRRVGATPSGQSLWKCECACGTKDTVHSSALLRGRSTRCRSCGSRQALITRRANEAAAI